MGQLNHRNIVPILTFARSDSGLRGICMPYRPGVTLDELIKKIGRESPPRNARALWELIRSDESQESLPQEDRHSGWDDFPIDGTFAEAVVWIGLALSDALEYLHSQPVLHRDIKPANILLAYQEGPMLLDFNLSQKPGTPETVSASMKGGTLPYMAPEHLHAFLEVSGWQDVDRPADLYSLGLVLRELLTGTEPELPDAKLSLPRAIRGLIYSRSRPRASTRELNPLIPPSLDSILAKCLEFEPAHRYASAADLSLDLRRFLERRPLASAPNPSRAERGANWIYRNRRFLGSLALFCVFVFGFLLLRTPNSIPDRSDFRRAENQLESTKPADWEKARETFLRIRRDRPDSAWPVIYLALALDKIDSKKKSEEVSSLLRQACDQPDVEVVFRSTLRKEPGSLLMLMNYGLLLIKLNRDAEAWGYLQRALVIDRDQIMALSALIKLEKDSKHYERAVELGRKAISLGLEFNLGRSKIYSFRYQMLASLLKLTENTIENGKNSTDRAQAARLLNEIDSTLTAMTDDLSKTPTGQGTNIHLYIVPFYRGTVASGRAILASDNHDFERARTLFDDANHWFQVASEKLSESDVNNLETYRSAIKIQRELMELRQARFQKNLKIGPHN
jgi:tetratricopeptide (TPR) repeat protein